MAVPPSTSRRKEKKCKIAFREVRRKLLLALETTNKQDRDVVCAEVFADITGRLNKRLQVGRRSLFAASLFAPNVTALLYLLSSFPPAPSPARTSSTSRAGTRPLRHLDDDEEAADEMLSFFKRLWGQVRSSSC